MKAQRGLVIHMMTNTALFIESDSTGMQPNELGEHMRLFLS